MHRIADAEGWSPEEQKELAELDKKYNPTLLDSISADRTRRNEAIAANTARTQAQAEADKAYLATGKTQRDLETRNRVEANVADSRKARESSNFGVYAEKERELAEQRRYMEGDKPMIDVLIKEKLTDQLIHEFVSHIFNTSTERIIVTSNDDLSTLPEIDFFDIDCFCVKSDVNGDVSLLLSLYRYELYNNSLIRCIQNACEKFRITCYIPMDSFDNWYRINGICETKTVKELESEENCFKFSE